MVALCEDVVRIVIKQLTLIEEGTILRRSLLSCALVAKGWMEPALEHLWNSGEGSDHCNGSLLTKLVKIAEPRKDLSCTEGWETSTRRAVFYCGFIKKVVLHNISNEQLQTLSMVRTIAKVKHLFPKVQDIRECCIELDCFIPKQVKAVDLLASPALKTFTAVKAAPDSSLALKQLARNAPELISLGLPIGVMANGFHKWMLQGIEMFQNLRVLTVSWNGLTLEGLGTLARLPMLAELDIRSGWPADRVSTAAVIFSQISRKRTSGTEVISGFKALTALYLRVEGVGANEFIESLLAVAFSDTALRHLAIDTNCLSPERRVEFLFPTTFKLDNIETISILAEEAHVDAALQQLEVCSALIALTVRSSFAITLEENLIALLTSHWPCLERLELNPAPTKCRGLEQWSPKITLNVVPAILQSCPRLKHLALCVAYEPTSPPEVKNIETRNVQLDTLYLGHSFAQDPVPRKFWEEEVPVFLSLAVISSCGIAIDNGKKILGMGPTCIAQRDMHIPQFMTGLRVTRKVINVLQTVTELGRGSA